jgi:hypothetical protein
MVIQFIMKTKIQILLVTLALLALSTTAYGPVYGLASLSGPFRTNRTGMPPNPTVVAPITLSGVFSNGYFLLTVTCQPGLVYVVQGSTNLTSWVPLSTNTNTTGTFTFTDTTTPAPPQCFYRALRQ